MRNTVPHLANVLQKPIIKASGARKAQVNKVREAVLAFNGDVQVEPFSSLKKQGVDKLRQKLDSWFNDLEPATEAEAE